MNNTEQSEVFTRRWTKAAPAVATYIRGMIRDYHAAEDILQDVAVVLFRKFDRYDPALPFTGWAIGVARNEVLMHMRKRKRDFITVQSDIVDTIGEMCSEMEGEISLTSHALRECVDKVQKRNRRLLGMCYVDGLTPGEIAAREGVSSGAVRIVLFRIRKFLLACVQRGMDAERSQA